MEVVMLEKFFVRPESVDRIRSSWIGKEVEQYVCWLSDHGYSVSTISRRIPIVIQFGEFARGDGVPELKDLPLQVEPFVEKWLAERCGPKMAAHDRKKVGQCVRNSLRQMLRLAVPGYVGLKRHCQPDNPFETSAPKFFDFLQEEKGLRKATIMKYRHSLRKLAAYFKKIGLKDVAHLSPPILSGLVAELSPVTSWSELRNTCGVIRVFIRYLHRERVLAKDFSNTLEAPKNYRLSGLTRSISWDDVRRVLETVERRSAVGKRDYAILLLLVTYGLRAREIAALTLDDIDWRNDRLRIPERKAGHSTGYPLSKIVGEAIVDYLKNGRPKSSSRNLFLRSMAPIQPVGPTAVTCCAARYLAKAGIKIPRAGSHTFRHTCAQRLLDAGLTLKGIGDYLGHRSPSSTQIYTKVAIEVLRQVALGDGEEAI